ncbi:CobW family GTP-binding protein [Ruegeria profundi]|uniref:CobW C-terminal domain-containing protein n=1 Tax=Ruegeria profundi TaxID=1685378 RepID=A0A0X3TU66_9RHOB|nr:GTP-binding protein [Ruegeria profundi]KUJ79274.1 hypothetical protein AVO44_08540 [Ruegeria profundi]
MQGTEMTRDRTSPKEAKLADASSVAAKETTAMHARAWEARQGINEVIFAALKMKHRPVNTRSRWLPLTVIGGFLGSGKTTLLKHLLVSPHGRRLVVLVNDFGRINIDAALVESQTDDMISLSNGCACCAVSADLTNTLIEIAERDDPPDAVVLEASGVADPYGIVMAALTNPAIRLDGSVTVVDAETMQDLAEDPLTKRLFRNQNSAADLVVLSKMDLLDAPAKAAARDWMAANYPNKPLIETVDGDVPVDAVLGIGSQRDLQADAPAKPVDAHGFGSVDISIDEPLDSDRLHTFLDALPASLLRAKGVLNLAKEPERRTIYQRVGRRWSYTSGEPWGTEKPHSSLVFIGPAGTLDRAALTERVRYCVATDPHPDRLHDRSAEV